MRVNGNRNPDYKSTFLFENDYHAVHMNLDEYKKTRDTEMIRGMQVLNPDDVITAEKVTKIMLLWS